MMFDIFPKLLSSVASFLFPLFASYKALKTADPAQLTPWLMYWVVLACALLVESWTEWFLVWIPFYAYIRLLFLLYLVLPQTQGARFIYEEYIHPKLEENETAIEEFIASSHERLRSAGIAYIKRAIELFKTNVLGLPPPPEAAAAAPPEPQTPQSYTQALLARFTLPSARWTAAVPTAASTSTPASDFYSLLASAVSAAIPSSSSSSASSTTAAATTTTPASNLNLLSSWLIPESLRSAPAQARVSFIQAQRERLRVVMSALDKAAEQEQQQGAEAEAEATQLGSEDKLASGRRSLSEQSVASGLSKSRSEADFEKLEAESGEEGEMDATPLEASGSGSGSGVRRRAGQEGAGGGQGEGAKAGWGIPWGWGGGGGNAGRSSGLEK